MVRDVSDGNLLASTTDEPKINGFAQQHQMYTGMLNKYLWKLFLNKNDGPAFIQAVSVDPGLTCTESKLAFPDHTNISKPYHVR